MQVLQLCLQFFTKRLLPALGAVRQTLPRSRRRDLSWSAWLGLACGRAFRSRLEIYAGFPGTGKKKAWLSYSKTLRVSNPGILAALGVLVGMLGMGSVAVGAEPEPPPVVLRDLAKAPRVAKGTSITLEQTTATVSLAGRKPWDVSAEAVLFLPEGWEEEITSAGQVRLALHFHGAPWFAIEEHARRGARHPLIAFYLGEGSSMYQKPFEDREKLARVLEKAAKELAGREQKTLEFAPLEVQSFSAGYGAVRELLKDEEWKKRIARIVLADSLYAGLTTATATGKHACLAQTYGLVGDEIQVPEPEQMKPFEEYARRAVQGETQFLFAHSTIRFTAYADTHRTAEALVCALDGTREAVTTGSIPAAAPDGDFPLVSRFDQGMAHVWGYRGTNPKAHMAVARTIAEFWKALDEEWKRGGGK